MKMFISLFALALLLIPALAMPGPMDLLPVGGPILGPDIFWLLGDICTIKDDVDPRHGGGKGGPVDFGLNKTIRDDTDPTNRKGGPRDFGLDKVIHDAPDPVGMSVKGNNR